VSLSANFGSLFINALDYNPARVWSLGGSILAPLFNGGRLQGQFDAASAQRDQAAYAYRGVVIKAFGDVETALVSSQQLQAQWEHAKEREKVLGRTLGFAKDRYEAGYASYLEELDAQRNLFAVQQEVLRLRQNQLENAVALYQALGGGWQLADTAAPQP
jgi:outer membrane protein TolC